MSKLRIAVIGDIHYVHHADSDSTIPARKGRMGRELLRRALYYCKNQLGAEVVVILGDVVEDGRREGAKADLVELKAELDEFQIRYFVVPGNHDGDFAQIYDVFGDTSGAAIINNVRLFFFHDQYDALDRASRDPQSLCLLQSLNNVEMPLIVFQHNPVYPFIESSYPYNLQNADLVQSSYKKSHVALSVSAHYHRGIKQDKNCGVGYVTAPALCEAPHRLLQIEVKGNDAQTKEVYLAPPLLAKLQDLHVHTQFAYCAKDINAKGAVQRAEYYGLQKMALVEHSSHLYVEEEKFAVGKWFWDPNCVNEAKDKGQDRVAVYRKHVGKLRSAYVKVGLEIDAAFDGSPVVHKDDAQGWDILLGAVHRLPCDLKGPEPRIVKTFLDVHERFLGSGLIQVLAHPFRIFTRAHVETPTTLYKPLVQTLKENDVAAELNFHTGHQPDVRFFQLCLEAGVKLSLGSDAHWLAEVGFLTPHIEFLQRLGIAFDQIGSGDGLFRV